MRLRVLANWKDALKQMLLVALLYMQGGIVHCLQNRELLLLHVSSLDIDVCCAEHCLCSNPFLHVGWNLTNKFLNVSLIRTRVQALGVLSSKPSMLHELCLQVLPAFALLPHDFA